MEDSWKGLLDIIGLNKDIRKKANLSGFTVKRLHNTKKERVRFVYESKLFLITRLPFIKIVKLDKIR